MKRIAVVATEKEYADYLLHAVEKYLGKYARFESLSVAEVEEKGRIKHDYVLLSAFNIFRNIRSMIGEQTEIIVLTLSLSKRQMEKLNSVPTGTKALLVNFDERTCLETITSLYDAGFRDVELVPYYGEGDYDKSIKIAITPNEEHLVPEGIETVINLGESSVGVKSLYDIAEKLGVYEQFSVSEAIAARREYYYIGASMDRLLGEKENMMDKLRALIWLFDDGIILTDSLGRIIMCNNKAQKLLSFRSKFLNGFNICEIIPELKLDSDKDVLVEGQTDTLVSKTAIVNGEETTGYIVKLIDFEEYEKKQISVRLKQNSKSNAARYRFENIIGKSEIIRTAVKQAKRIARSDSSVLITGESGTGKEMFAQSIHNDSMRKKYGFVAINCAAIPENLLESELFGYEEGSFTGARKGGKPGYFELAHKGTLFLDEIGEMPLNLQAKLLRAIEEKKVARIGSTDEIDVDVRIIAATNKDLFTMTTTGQFREDLYYRINVLPLSLPPLRNHTEDLKELIDYYINNYNSSFHLSDEAFEKLESYSWRGNYRELRNVVEYLSSQEKYWIEVNDLPPLRFESNLEVSESSVLKGREDVSLANMSKGFSEYDELYNLIMSIIKECNDAGLRPGRKFIADKLREKGVLVGEGEVRSVLVKLSADKLIKIGKGRAGSSLTEKGKQYLVL